MATKSERKSGRKHKRHSREMFKDRKIISEGEGKILFSCTNGTSNLKEKNREVG